MKHLCYRKSHYPSAYQHFKNTNRVNELKCKLTCCQNKIIVLTFLVKICKNCFYFDMEIKTYYQFLIISKITQLLVRNITICKIGPNSSLQRELFRQIKILKVFISQLQNHKHALQTSYFPLLSFYERQYILIFYFLKLASLLITNNIIDKKQTLMHNHSEFNHTTDSEDEIIDLPSHQNIEVSILKHITAARKILQGQNRTYQIYSARCLYTEELNRINKYVLAKAEQNTKNVGSRLISIEDAVFQHGKMKQKIKQLYNKNQKELTSTLWDIYNDREIYYHRFEPNFKKHNFANIFMSIAGINLEPKTKANNFPHIKPKGPQNLPKNNNGSLIFDSHFESGNLLYVYKNNDQRNTYQTYDLILQNDINSRGHNQWFYFKVTNTKKNQRVKFNIVNLVKKQSLFSYGLKPLTFSEKNYKNGIGWVRNGNKINYQESSIKREHKNQSYYTLSFEYQFRQAYDTVYFTPSYPYSYSQLLYYMDRLLSNKKYTNILSIKKLCQTVGKNTVNLISISTGKQTIKDSKIIWILARQHPVQTTSSFMVEGIINYLVQLMAKAVQQGYSFYDGYIFKIIPMCNPDGVIHGNTRAELTGIDPNRVWIKPSKNVTPTVYNIKKQIMKTKDEACLVIDLHSHSKKLGCFFYGNYQSSDVKSFRLLPSTICKDDSRFCYKNSRFRGGNDNSARRTLFNQLKIPNIFTVECSLLGYIKDNRINEYKISDYEQMGVKIIQTFFHLQIQKAGSPIKTIKQYPNQANDFCDAQSARSDSCVSEQQYAQVYNFRLKKKKQKQKENQKKGKLKSNTNIYTHKYHLSQHLNNRKMQCSQTKAKQQFKSEQTIFSREQNRAIQKINTLQMRQSNSMPKQQIKKQLSFKLKTKIGQRNMRINKKRNINSIKQEFDEQNQVNKVCLQKSVQVEQQLKNINQNYQTSVKLKTEKKLIIVGNSVQQQKISVNKNEVGIQMDTLIKQNCNSHQLSFKCIRNGSNKVKIHRKLHQNDQNTLPDHSIKLQKRGVLMFRN